MRALILFLFISETALAVSGLPDFMSEVPNTSLETRILGRSALIIQASPISLDANPAYLAPEEKFEFQTNLNLGSGYYAVDEYISKIQRNEVLDVIDKFLNTSEPVMGRSFWTLWFQNDWWAVQFTPLRLATAFTTFNPAYPLVRLQVVRERELLGKTGFLLAENKNVFVGFQLRGVDREYLDDEFYFLDAMSDQNLLRPRKEKALYFEPSIIWRLDEFEWNPEFSISLSNWRIARSGDVSKSNPLVDLGFSVRPDGLNNTQVGLLFSPTDYTSNYFRKFALASLIAWSEEWFTPVSLSTKRYAVGVRGRFDSVVVGLGYSAENIVMLTDMRWAHELQLEVGLTF